MKKKQKLVFEVISYIFIGIALLLALLGIIVKINKGTLYLFDVRADVVLSDSMSEKNEKYADFLKGHDDQIQKMDLVFSSKVTKDTNLEVYDIVLFYNPSIGTTMHRIVGKTEKHSDIVTVSEMTFAKLDDKNMIQLNEVGSSIKTNFLSYKSAEVVLYSVNDYDERYNYYTGGVASTVKVDTTKIKDYYKHVITITRETEAPNIFLISHKDYRDYSGDYFESISIGSSYGDIFVTPNELVLQEDGTYQYKTNTTYNYEIRGDKAPTSDGIFTIDDIYSKVTWVMPKAGYFVRYITSIYGMILLVSIPVILIIVQVVLEVSEKKNKEKSVNNTDEIK